jgi:hypothetical protein
VEETTNNRCLDIEIKKPSGIGQIRTGLPMDSGDGNALGP